MTTVNIIEDSNNPTKYIIISSQAGTGESVTTTRVLVGNSSNNRLNLIEVSKIPGEKGDKGDKGDIGPAGKDGVVFSVLPVISGGTNNTSFTNNKVIYFDGTKLNSSNLDIDNIQTDIISNIYGGDGLSETVDGSSVTIKANLGEGLTIVGENDIGIDTNFVITKSTLDLSDSSFYQGILPISYGGTNNSFFALNSLVYYDGTKLASYPIPTGKIVHSGQSVFIEAGSGLIGGGDLILPNGSIVLHIKDSDDIVVFDDHIELSNVVSAGTYTKVQVNNKGRVVAGSNLTLSDIINAVGGTPWTSDNDGADSGLDADLLDGQHGHYYRDGSNITGTISSNILPDTINPGWAPKVEFNSKGLIIDSGILQYLDITNGLGYVPFDKSGGTILGDVEIFGNIIADSGYFDNNTITIGESANTTDIRGIKFRYNDVPAQYAVLAYYPQEDLFRISQANESSSGVILTLERADSKYVAVTGDQSISGIKTFLNNIQLYSRLIVRNPYPELSPFDIGTNSTLVQFLNSDFLDGEHGYYYRNAANLTGTLNPLVIIPHIQERGEAYYVDSNDPGSNYVEYFPIFHVPSTDHPMVLRSSHVYQTGYIIYMDSVSTSIGNNIFDDNAINSLLVGTNNSGDALALNSMAVGQNNTISGTNSVALNYFSTAVTENSIALGKYAETWINEQIAIGGFKNFNIGNDGIARKDSHGQLSYIPLKFHGESSSWTSILSFPFPDNKTLEYEAELLFTKQKNTGVASFTITPGIIKNYGYRDREQGYAAFKLAKPVTHHSVIENYNNSQERIYNLPIDITIRGFTISRTNTLEVTAPPYQYEPLDIESYADPIIVYNKSDFATSLKATRNSSDLQNQYYNYGYDPVYYRDNFVIKLEPYDQSYYNSGSPINLGKNIKHNTECLFYRESGNPLGIIKFPNHGISPSTTLESDIVVGTGNVKIKARKDTIFNIVLPKYEQTDIVFSGLYREKNDENHLIYRTYLNKNIVDGISGTFSFNIYRVSGTLSSDQNLLPPQFPDDINTYTSEIVDSLSLSFKATEIGLPNFNWSALSSENISLNIMFDNYNTWEKYGLLETTGYINGSIGLLEIDLNATYPLSGDPVFLYTDYDEFSNPYDVYYYPNYYLDDNNATIRLYPYQYYSRIQDNFSYIDNNTLGFMEQQLGYVSGENLVLIGYFNNLRERVNNNNDFNLNSFSLSSGDCIYVNNSIANVTGVLLDSYSQKHYLLDNSYPNSIVNITLANGITGICLSEFRGKTVVTGTYNWSKSSNNNFSKIYESGFINPIVDDVPVLGCTPDEFNDCLFSVPTGSFFKFIFDSGSFSNTTLYDDNEVWTFFGSANNIASSSVIVNSADEYVDIPAFVFPESSLVSSGQYVSTGTVEAFDFRIDNLRITDLHAIRYDGYNDDLDGSYVPALFSSGNHYRYYLPEHKDSSVFSYKFINTSDSNSSYSIFNSFRPQINRTIPNLGNNNNRMFRLCDIGLLSSSYWDGSVDILGLQNLNFSIIMDPLEPNTAVLQNAITGHIGSETIIIASATGHVIPDNISAWNDYGLSGLDINVYANADLYLKAYQSYDYGTYSGILTTGNMSGLNTYHRVNDRGMLITNIYPELHLYIQSATGQNTGVYAVEISNKQNYQTLNITCNSYNDYFRYIESSDTEDMYNNLNISFSLFNSSVPIVSGIWLPNTMSNKHINNKPYSKIYNIANSSNSNTFSIGVLSGYLPQNMDNTGLVTMCLPKIYELKPESFTPNNHVENRVFVDFNSQNNILQSGIYSKIDNTNLSPYSIYLYDWSRSFVTGADVGTGIISYNNLGYNVTDDKFSIWGNNFNGDIILHPWRDVPTFVSDNPGVCESGRLCIRFSGIPNYFQQDDYFWIETIPNIYPQPTSLIYATGYFVTGINGVNDQEIYLKGINAIESGVVLGMNVFGDYVSSNTYITSISNDIFRLSNSPSVYEGLFDSVNGPYTYPIKFSFNRETEAQNIATDSLREAWRNFVSGDYQIYRDEVAPNVVSILSKIPPFYYNSSDPNYSEWNTTQQTRGVNVWRNTGYTGISMMITGTENIQTDKNPNYGYRFLNLASSLTFDPVVTGYGLFDNFNIDTGKIKYRFALDELNKYLYGSSISGLFRPTTTSGLMVANSILQNASNWTMNGSKEESTRILFKDIDDFQLLGIDLIDSADDHVALNYEGNDLYTIDSMVQNSGFTLRFGLLGGAGIEDYSPKILVSGLQSSYRTSANFVYGIPDEEFGLVNYNTHLTPFSNSWYIDLYIEALNNAPSFSYNFKDILGSNLSGTIRNINQIGPQPYISNFTTSAYAADSLSPWVVSFDLENIESYRNIDVSGGSDGNIAIIGSGIVYNTYLNKWQAHAFGLSNTDTLYNEVPVGISGDIDIPYTGNLFVSSVNQSFDPIITNLSGLIKFANIGNDPISFYFNYQRPVGSTTNPTISIVGAPDNSIVTTNLINDPVLSTYSQATFKQLYKTTITNIGPTGYFLNINSTLGSTSNSVSNAVVVYDDLSISSLTVPDPTVYVGRNWSINLSTIGGGGPHYMPHIQLLNAPSTYGTGSAVFDYDNYGWDIRLTGNNDDLGRYNIYSGVYDIGLYITDVTNTGISSNISLTYQCLPELLDIQPWYALKNKPYAVNLNIANFCENQFNSQNSNINIPDFLPTTQYLYYKKYNPLINIYEFRYSGDPPIDKWDARINVTNLNNVYPADYEDGAFFSVDVKGLDTDVISVVGLLKMKELEVISTDYPPLEIQAVVPTEDETTEFTQGEKWKLDFNVVGGLSSPLYPPTVLLTGLPSLCSGYYPDEDLDGPPCLSAATFQNSYWKFAFTGAEVCDVGLYNISIKAFDLTGEDIAYTNMLYKPLQEPGPSVETVFESNNLYPNCLPFSGHIKITSPKRDSPCPYATGISGWQLIGSLPDGLDFVKTPTPAWELDQGNVLQITGLDPVYYTGVGGISITGIPTVFPEDNVYDSFTIRVTGMNEKTDQVIVTLTTAGIIKLSENPLGFALYFPNSGYYDPTYVVQGSAPKIRDQSQSTYKPYPGTGSMICRSSLSDNNCPTYYTGIYYLDTIQITGFALATENNQTNFVVTGEYGYVPNHLSVWHNDSLLEETDFTADTNPNIELSISVNINDEIRWSGLASSYSGIKIDFKENTPQQNNVYSVFEEDLTFNKNKIYQLFNIEADYFYDEETQAYTIVNSGYLSDLCDSYHLFSGINPISGFIQLMPFEVTSLNVPQALNLNAFPKPTIACNTCLLGDGELQQQTNEQTGQTTVSLVGKMRPSMIFNITGDLYPVPNYNSMNPCGDIPSLILVSGVSGSLLPGFSQPEQEEICYYNCYESGVSYISGIVLPTPVLELTDSQNVIYNDQGVALSIRCSFGDTTAKRNIPANYRVVDAKYYIQHLNSGLYWNNSNNTFVTEQTYSTITTSASPAEIESIGYAAPVLSSGAIYRIFIERESDEFPTTKVDSYPYTSSEYFWIHKAGPEFGDVDELTYPGFLPVGFGSGLFIPIEQLFSISGLILGGHENNLAPSLTSYLTLQGEETEVLDSSNDSHMIDTDLKNNITNGRWNVEITGLITDLSNSYLLNYDYNIQIVENIGSAYPKTTLNKIPVTFIKTPIELTVTSTNFDPTLPFGSKWQMSFNVVGGNRPPRYHNNINAWISGARPIIEINGEICNYDIVNYNYNQGGDTWSFTLSSRNIVTSNQTLNLVYIDKMGYSASTTQNVIVAGV